MPDTYLKEEATQGNMFSIQALREFAGV